MDLTLSPAEEEFRDTLRAWIEENHPGKEPEGDEASFAFRREWQRKLNERGWAGLTWPTEYGGAGATQIEQAILFEEFARSRAPQMANVLGLTMGGPTVIAHGTDEQKARFLAPILSADEMWCQGFSEPESGLRPRVAEDPRGARRATSTSSPARRCGRRSPITPSGACCSRAPTRTRPSTAG